MDDTGILRGGMDWEYFGILVRWIMVTGPTGERKGKKGMDHDGNRMYEGWK